MVKYVALKTRRNSTDYRPLRRGLGISLVVFCLSGTIGVCIDGDHLLRCLGDLTEKCITGADPKYFHSWVGLCLCICGGVVCACATGLIFGLVDCPH